MAESDRCHSLDHMQALLRAAFEIREAVAYQRDPRGPDGPGLALLGEMDWREEMAELIDHLPMEQLTNIDCPPVIRQEILKAPFPWFGGKSMVADIVWQRFGHVPNYIEPFFGSGAVLLGRPHSPGIETVNDLDCMVDKAAQIALDRLIPDVSASGFRHTASERTRRSCSKPKTKTTS